jgi:type I restriction enzyme R subunit
VIFHFHRPDVLADGLTAEPVWLPTPHRLSERPASLRLRLRNMPEVAAQNRWPAQLTAVRNLEKSLAENRPRALIQMATGSGKTFTAVTSIYRLVKHAGARRVLFLVDRANLGRQALREFQQCVTPDDGRKFTELYNVQRLTSNRFDGRPVYLFFANLRHPHVRFPLEQRQIEPAIVHRESIPVRLVDRIVAVHECPRRAPGD